MATTTNFELETPTPGGYRNTWGGTLNTTVTKLDELVALAMPLGMIQMYPLATAPVATTNGGTWLLCDGASLSRVTYATLFALIGTTYGNVDGNTFNLPDMRARSPLGYNTASGLSGSRSTRALALGSGAETHALSTGELAAHSHAIPATTHTHTITDSTHTHTGNASGNTGSTTLTASDSGHTHAVVTYTEWASHATDYGIAFDNGPFHTNVSTTSASANISVSPSSHSHSLTTTPTSHGVTGANAGVINITSTAPDTGSGTAHENMHPYLVINYIILAKHPSF